MARQIGTPREAERSPGYVAVIPAEVRYDPELPPSAKLLYGELTALAAADGYCVETNEYFARLYQMDKRTVSRLIGQLQARGHIRVEMVREKDGAGSVEWRRIYIGRQWEHPAETQRQGENLAARRADERGRNACQDGVDKNARPNRQKCPAGMDKNVYDNRCNINISSRPVLSPPYPPKGERAETEEQKDAWENEMFDRFWAAYPKKKAKQAARKAWKKLKPDLTTCRAMSKALETQKQSQEWSKDEGRYVPHPATWLNGRRWEDEPSTGGTLSEPPKETRTLRYIGTELVDGEERDIYA